jgi:hypothetical protein
MPADKPTKVSKQPYSHFAEIHGVESYPEGSLRRFGAEALTFFHWVGYTIGYETGKLGKYFKDEWNRENPPLGMFHKPFVLAKYTVLLGAGALACVPGYSAIVGLAAGAISGFSSANRNGFTFWGSIIPTLYGAVVGLKVGFIPVIGPGLACGIVRGTVEGVQDATINYVPVKGSFFEQLGAIGKNISMTMQTLAKSLTIGICRGAVPIVGLAVVSAKLDRASEKRRKGAAPSSISPEGHSAETESQEKGRGKATAQVDKGAAVNPFPDDKATIASLAARSPLPHTMAAGGTTAQAPRAATSSTRAAVK